jgi:uncharacterized alkaline shock family protein YloU
VREVLAPPAQRGHLEIRPAVVDRIARRAAVEVDGVVGGSVGRLARHDLPATRSRVDGRRVRLDVDVAVLWGRPLADVAAGVADRVRSRVTGLTGLAVDGVDVTVLSVVVPDETAGRRVR